MAARVSTGSARSCCSASAGCGPFGPSARSAGILRRRSSTQTRATPGFSAWSASANAQRKGSISTRRLRRAGSGPCSPPTRPSPRASTAFPEGWSRRTSPANATNPGGDPAIFNMAVMGMRLSQRVNGVSALHGQVSREMFGGLWHGFDTAEVPVGSVTNGVHAPTWGSREIFELADREIGPELVQHGRGWDRVSLVPGERIWKIRRLLRERLVSTARQRLRASWCQRGASDAELGWTDEALDPDVLTIGFARRVPSYKRLTLMLRDPDRLTKLLLNADRPLQIVIAGKAHPADEGGKGLIQQMVRFADDPQVRHRIVFLPDYDMALGRDLVQGCDVWLNNPLRPLEACGTSGMKAALNGGLNVSIRDGWWDEWFDGTN